MSQNRKDGQRDMTSSLSLSATESQSARAYLFVVPWELTSTGGVNEVVKNLYDQVAHSTQLSPIVLVESWSHLAPQQTEEDGTRVIRLRLRSPLDDRRPLYGLFSFVAHLPAELGHMRGLFRAEDVAVVNVHYPTPAAITIAIAKLLRLYRGKLIVSLHGTDVRQAASVGGLHRWALSRVLQAADTVVACSRGLRDEIAQYFPNLRDVEVIHNGIDIERTEAEVTAEAAWAQRFQRPYILSIGTFIEDKGQRDLVSAYHNALSSGGVDADLILVGRDGNAWDEIAKHCEELGLDSRVTMLRDLSHSRCMALLSRAQFFVLPSKRESFSVVLLEAAALRVPIIATDVGGVRELLDDESCGLIVDSGDLDGMTRAIRQMASEEDRRAACAARMFARLQERFSWREAGLKYLGLTA